jgi:arsenate reductase-like glutaredoxin family protein
MKTASFRDYLEKRLNKEEIREIRQQVDNEFEALKGLQENVSWALTDYMEKEKIGFNEMVRRLSISPTQLSKIQKCEANLTLATLAHISALLKKRPHLIFKN